MKSKHGGWQKYYVMQNGAARLIDGPAQCMRGNFHSRQPLADYINESAPGKVIVVRMLTKCQIGEMGRAWFEKYWAFGGLSTRDDARILTLNTLQRLFYYFILLNLHLARFKTKNSTVVLWSYATVFQVPRCLYRYFFSTTLTQLNSEKTTTAAP